MPQLPIWLSRLETDLVVQHRKAKVGSAGTGGSTNDSAALLAASSATLSPAAKAAAEDAAAQKGQGERPTSPLQDPTFDRVHIRNSRVGELLVPVRQAGPGPK